MLKTKSFFKINDYNIRLFAVVKQNVVNTNIQKWLRRRYPENMHAYYVGVQTSLVYAKEIMSMSHILINDKLFLYYLFHVNIFIKRMLASPF